jgi:uncharacterized protein
MRTRTSAPASFATSTPTARLPLRMALWLLDSQHLGRNQGVKRIAGRLLKQPAREGVVEAQSRLGRLLCCECDSQRDRRIGFELLRLAITCPGRLCGEPDHPEPAKARLWLEQAAAQGSHEAARVLRQVRG